MRVNSYVNSYVGGSLVYLDVLDDDGKNLYTLEVGCSSGLVCLENTNDYFCDGKKVDTYVHYTPVTHLCGEMPEIVQNAILALFDGVVR